MKPSKKNLKKFSFIQTLKKCKPLDRKHIIEFLDEEGLNILGETCHNILYCDHNLNKKTVNRLKRRFKNKKKSMTILADKSIPTKKRKSILIKEGGGAFSLLLSIALPVLANLIFGHS